MEDNAGTGQGEQIGSMLSDFTPGGPDTGEKVKGGKGKPDAQADKGQTDEGGGTGEIESEEGEEGAEGAEKEGQESEVEALQRQIGELTAKLEGLATGKPAEQPQQQESAPLPVDKFFDTQEEFDKSFENMESMNKVLSKVSVATAQRILSNLPKIVNNMVKSQVEVQGKVRDFYMDNKDLVNHKQFVGYVASDLSGKNPSWTVDKLFTELGKEVRKRIGLKGMTDRAGVLQKGAFPPSKRGARPPARKPEELSQLEKEISSLID